MREDYVNGGDPGDSDQYRNTQAGERRWQQGITRFPLSMCNLIRFKKKIDATYLAQVLVDAA